MIKVGIIGYGSMGSMITNAVILKNFLKPDELIVSTKTKSKLDSLKKQWNTINISDNKTTAKEAKYLIVCVKPNEVLGIINEVKEHLTIDKHLITIAGDVTLSNLESKTDIQISKVIPSITSEVFEGITLICHNDKVNHDNKKFIEDLFSAISSVKIIKEENFEAGAHLTSCAPGLISAIFQNFLEAGVRNSSIPEKEVYEMIIKTLYGTAKLLNEKNMDFKEVITRVATKGGITEEGVKVLNNHLPNVFDKVFEATFKKHDIRKKEISDLFSN